MDDDTGEPEMTYPYGGGSFQGTGGNPSDLGMPSPYGNDPIDNLSMSITAVSDNGYCGPVSYYDSSGDSGPSDVGGAQYIYQNQTGIYTVFDTGTNQSASQLDIFHEYFWPSGLSDSGWAFGTTGTACLSNSTGNLVFVAPMTSITAINDAGEAIGIDQTGTAGYLWKPTSNSGGSTVTIYSLIPQVFQPLVQSIVPIAISGTDSHGNTGILLSGTFQPTATAPQTSGTLLLITGTGAPTLQQVALPSNVSISSSSPVILNAQDILAEIGTITSGSTTVPNAALLLVPLQINEVTSLNPSPGRPLTSASAACVGEPVTLSISGTNIFPGYKFVSSLQWNAPNAIKNYDTGAFGSNYGLPPIVNLTLSDSTSSPISLYYPVIPQSGDSTTTVTSGTTPVSCTLTLVTGGTCTVTGSLNLVAPAVQITGSMPGLLGTVTKGSVGYLGDGYNAAQFPHSSVGMEINSSGVMPPHGFTSGSAAWLQVITDVVSAVTNGTYAYGNQEDDVNANDHGFPYPSWAGPNVSGTVPYVSGNVPFTTSDSPIWPVIEPSQTELDRTFNGMMYNMWRSDVPNSIWVPLSVMNWGFQGEIIWSPARQRFIWGGNSTRLSVRITAPPGAPTWETSAY